MGTPKLPSILLLLFFPFHSALSEPIVLDNEHVWSLDLNKVHYSVRVGARLTNQLPNVALGDRIKYTVDFRLDNPSETTGLLIPFVGGKTKVEINGSKVFSSEDEDFEGLLIPIQANKGQNTLVVSIVCGSPLYCGLWRDLPEVGELSTLVGKRESKIRRDRYFPLFTGLALIFSSMFFYACFFALRKKYSSYFIFATTLFSWGLFYISFSGIIRVLSQGASSVFHFPLRTIAAAFTALLIASYSGTADKYKRIVAIVICPLLVLQLIAGYLDFAFAVIVITIFSSSLSLLSLLTFRVRSLSTLTKVIFALSVIAAVGQFHDAVILMNGFGNIKITSKFVNQFTFPPLILMSFAQHILEFLNQFQSLRLTVLKVKRLTRLAVRLSGLNWTSDAIALFLREIKSITKVERVSIATKSPNGGYYVTAVTGLSEEFIGSSIDTNTNKYIAHTIESGEVNIGTIRNHGSWSGEYFACIPSPKQKDPHFLLLLSDPKNLRLFEKTQLPFLSQVSTILWSFYSRCIEEFARKEAENKFSSFVQKLDPNLFEFISKNIEKVEDTSRMVSSERGIVFFDQKAYSTMTELLTDEQMARFSQIVSEWVTKYSARFGARVLNFAGDAYLLEVFGIGEETADSIAKRTVDLAWGLAQNLGELNKTLISEKFSPVTYRFGAHIGATARVNLDYIQKGLSNSVGDTVNIAARLQSIAREGTILVSGELAYYLRNSYIFNLVPKQYLKGRSKRIEVYSVHGKYDEEKMDVG